ncbi:MAG: alpha/beta hydrolase [Bryobacterales bacterium]|nr:alpha/beta hydrolase [Bryobacteraceae bacterium]MDW8131658.1 alpha/beta hydrolase [Bryobacterales bacterium]
MKRRASWLILFAALAHAQAGKESLPPPDVADAAYGPHERHRLDLWRTRTAQPAPLVIYIHGGGFRSGDKRTLPPSLLTRLLESGISVAAINYRFSQHAPYPAPMEDGARAVQFLRLHAKQWRLNPRAFGATGASAGAGIALWVGLRDDMAQPESPDPLRRQSTRLQALALAAAQTTYDPREIARVVGQAAARHPALEPFYGLRGDELNSEKAERMFREASPVNYATRDDPPVLLLYFEADKPLPPDAKPGDGIHHPRFGLYLKERMDKLGVECLVRYPGDGGPPIDLSAEIAAFFRRHLHASGSGAKRGLR